MFANKFEFNALSRFFCISISLYLWTKQVHFHEVFPNKSRNLKFYSSEIHARLYCVQCTLYRNRFARFNVNHQRRVEPLQCSRYGFCRYFSPSSWCLFIFKMILCKKWTQERKRESTYFDLLICILGIIFLLALLFHSGRCLTVAVSSYFMLLQEFTLLELCA